MNLQKIYKLQKQMYVKKYITKEIHHKRNTEKYAKYNIDENSMMF